jgi:hypothetical protein
VPCSVAVKIFLNMEFLHACRAQKPIAEALSKTEKLQAQRLCQPFSCGFTWHKYNARSTRGFVVVEPQAKRKSRRLACDCYKLMAKSPDHVWRWHRLSFTKQFIADLAFLRAMVAIRGFHNPAFLFILLPAPRAVRPPLYSLHPFRRKKAPRKSYFLVVCTLI